MCFEVVSPYDADGRLEQCPGWHEFRFGSGQADVAQLAGELAALVAAADLAADATTTSEAGLLEHVAEAVSHRRSGSSL
jgi:hypothetical protein